MRDTPRQTKSADRVPACVTEIRKGNTLLTVSGYFKQDATETASDKMGKVIAAEHAIEAYHRKNVG